VHAEPVGAVDRAARDPLGHAGGRAHWRGRALSDAGYATGMWGKCHLGSDPEQRSPVDFGFDEAVWSPRTPAVRG
jgi:arylsulfatase